MQKEKKKSAWGGRRPGAGRPATGRKYRKFYVTEDEYQKLKQYLAKLRQGNVEDVL